MKHFPATILAAFLIAACGHGAEEAPPPAPYIPEPNFYGFIDDSLAVRTDTVKSGDTFGQILELQGIDGATTSSLISLGDSLFDVRKLRAGQTLAFYVDTVSGAVKYIVYEKNRVSSTVFKCSDSLAVWNADKPLVHERRTADITLKTSLWNDMAGAGASPTLIMDMADIFQWSVNFFSLQQGDRFRIIYTRSLCEGEEVAIDTVHFCLYETAEGKQTGAMRYDIGPGYGKYWGKNGEGMKKMFLKAPLKFNRISSRFSYHRKHPVTGKVRPHTGVDYAAPTGTPVQALGDGKVTACGWDNSGGGNRIRIKHAQGYETCYMHLSKFAKGIKVGSTVSQGQVIAYVGSTGRSTGPHLDFRIWLNGKALDPLKVSSPNTDPLPGQYLEDFNARYEACIRELNGN